MYDLSKVGFHKALKLGWQCFMVVKSQGFGSDYMDLRAVLPFPSSVTLDKTLNLSEPQSSDEDCTNFIGPYREVGKIIQAKSLE